MRGVFQSNRLRLVKIELLVKVVLHCSEYGKEEKIAIGTSNSQIQTSNSHISEGTIANCERADFLKIKSHVKSDLWRHAMRADSLTVAGPTRRQG